MQIAFILNLRLHAPPKRLSFSSQTSMTDSEYNIDPNCLSRCSTEFFSEASWERVDRQDTEVKQTLSLFVLSFNACGGSQVSCVLQVTRWFPDHLAAQCYGCESTFWLAARKHHCR